MEPITIQLPIYLMMGKKKKKTISLNLNCYRNWDHHQNNNIKIFFGEVVEPLIRHLPRMAKVKLTYMLFFGSKRAIDISNICSIVDKFFSDTLVNAGKLPDDHMEIISEVAYKWGDVDSQNPRVEVTLTDIEVIEENPPMKILVTQSEIQAAIVALVQQQIVIREDQSVVVEMQADGSAIINVTGAITGAPAMTAAQAEGMTKAPAPAPKAAAAVARAEKKAEPATPPKVETAKVEPVKVETPEPAEAIKEPEPEIQPEAAPAPVAAAPKAIFPSATSSAAPGGPAKADPVPANSGSAPAGPKSLFANLKAPKNEPTQAPSVN